LTSRELLGLTSIRYDMIMVVSSVWGWDVGALVSHGRALADLAYRYLASPEHLVVNTVGSDRSLVHVLFWSSLFSELPDVLFVSTLLCLVAFFVVSHHSLEPLLKLEDIGLFQSWVCTLALSKTLSAALKFWDQLRIRMGLHALGGGRVEASRLLVWGKQEGHRLQVAFNLRDRFLISFSLDISLSLRIRIWASRITLLLGTSLYLCWNLIIRLSVLVFVKL